MNKKYLFFAVFLCALFFLASDASALTFRGAGFSMERYNGPYAEAVIIDRAQGLLYDVIGVVLIIGGFGLVGLSVAAIFGTVKWKWAAYLGFGLFLNATIFMTLGYLGYDAGSYLSMNHDMITPYQVVVTGSILPSD